MPGLEKRYSWVQGEEGMATHNLAPQSTISASLLLEQMVQVGFVGNDRLLLLMLGKNLERLGAGMFVYVCVGS